MMPEIALNILDIAENSVRAGASLIEITVSVQPEEDSLTVTIRDNGCGIPEDLTDTIFEPFVTYKENGTGLGLSSSKQTIEAHGGTIYAQSSPETGTVFTVTLPV